MSMSPTGTLVELPRRVQFAPRTPRHGFTRRAPSGRCVLFLVAGLVLTGTSPGQENATVDQMECLTKAFRAVETASAAGALDVVVQQAAELQRKLREVSVPKAGVVSGSAAGFEVRRAATLAAAERLALHAGQHETGDVRIAIEGLRVACIACHVTVRARNETRGAFPAAGNTLWGHVEIRDLKNAPRKHRTGVVAFVDEVDTKAATRAPAILPVMSQKSQVFRPRVLPVVAGTKVAFPNDDSVFHDVFSLSKTQPFDLEVYGKGKEKEQKFRRTGLVRIHCNIHPKMVATILVLANPFFGVTDDSGLYVITGIPDGKHTLRVWHEFGGGKSVELEFSEDTAVRRDFTLRETRRLVPHRNKFGLRYRNKY